MPQFKSECIVFLCNHVRDGVRLEGEERGPFIGEMRVKCQLDQKAMS